MFCQAYTVRDRERLLGFLIALGYSLWRARENSSSKRLTTWWLKLMHTTSWRSLSPLQAFCSGHFTRQCYKLATETTTSLRYSSHHWSHTLLRQQQRWTQYLLYEEDGLPALSSEMHWFPSPLRESKAALRQLSGKSPALLTSLLL